MPRQKIAQVRKQSNYFVRKDDDKLQEHTISKQ